MKIKKDKSMMEKVFGEYDVLVEHEQISGEWYTKMVASPKGDSKEPPCLGIGTDFEAAFAKCVDLLKYIKKTRK